MWAISFTNWLIRVTQVYARIALLILPHEHGQAFTITSLAALLIVFVAMGRHPSLPTLATVEGETLATPELMSWYPLPRLIHRWIWHPLSVSALLSEPLPSFASTLLASAFAMDALALHLVVLATAFTFALVVFASAFSLVVLALGIGPVRIPTAPAIRAIAHIGICWISLKGVKGAAFLATPLGPSVLGGLLAVALALAISTHCLGCNLGLLKSALGSALGDKADTARP